MSKIESPYPIKNSYILKRKRYFPPPQRLNIQTNNICKNKRNSDSQFLQQSAPDGTKLIITAIFLNFYPSSNLEPTRKINYAQPIIQTSSFLVSSFPASPCQQLSITVFSKASTHFTTKLSHSPACPRATAKHSAAGRLHH